MTGGPILLIPEARLAGQLGIPVERLSRWLDSHPDFPAPAREHPSRAWRLEDIEAWAGTVTGAGSALAP